MNRIRSLGRRLDRRFPRLVNRTGRLIAPVERLIKSPVFGCHMCGQCVLHSTGMTCPMECPKKIRNGPCGGVGLDGSCEVDKEMPCVWHKAVTRGQRGPWTAELYQGNPAVDWTLQGTSAWVNSATGRDHHDRVGPQWQRVELRPRKETTMKSGSRLERLLLAGEFVVTVEVQPGDSADAARLIDHARSLEGLVDAVHVSDNAMSRPHMSALAAAGLLELQTELETVLHVTCRDRNRLMLQSDLLGAHAMGIRNILCLGGNHPAVGDHPEAKPVFDLDSVNLIGLARRMRDKGVFESGRKLEVAPRLFIGGAVGPAAPPFDFRPHRMAKKIAAGVDFIATQLIFDMRLFRNFMTQVNDVGLTDKTHILVSLGALPGPEHARAINEHGLGVTIPEAVIRRLEAAPQSRQRDVGLEIAVEQIHELGEIPGVSGIDLIDLEPEIWFTAAQIIERAQLPPRESLSSDGAAHDLSDLAPVQEADST